METEGDPLSPGTSYGPPPSYSAHDATTPTFLNRTLQASCSSNMREELLPSRSSWPRVGDEGIEQIGSLLPRADPGRSPLPREDPGRSPLSRPDPGRSPLPREDPGRSPLPREDPGRSPLPREDPGRSPLPREDPGRSPLPRADPGRSPLPREDPGRSPLSRPDPGRSPLPREDPGRSPLPRADPGRSPLPREDPGRSPLPREDPGRSPLPRADPGRSPLPREDPGRSPLPRADTGRSPTPREDPGRSPLPRADPGRSPLPRADPGRSPTPREDPGRSPTPREDPGRSPTPREDPGRSPTPKEDTGRSPTPREDPGRSPTPREDPEKSPLPREDPGRSPTPREDPEKSPLPREDPEKSPLPRENPERSTQRRFRPSAFPSSLTWDSDSEKETLDEEELQHFSNPHGLAAHSPGSPSSGFRLDSEDDQAPVKLQHLLNESNTSSSLGGRDQDDGSTKREEPNTSQLRPMESADAVWNVSERAELSLSKVKPKEGHQMEEENHEGKKIQMGGDTEQSERDVYSFPGDSDPESPPPAPWAHCTFIQRRRKKRALLRPFSGLGTWQRTSPEAARRARIGPQRSKTAESAQVGGSGGVCDFEKAELVEGAELGEKAKLGEEAVKEPVEVKEESAGRGGIGERGEQEGEDGAAESDKQIFTCVECSIYFKKQVHLQEHMTEHCQSGSVGGRRERMTKSSRFRCVECGWNLPNRLALADHHRRHQESREKILEEIEKLNDSGKVDEMQREESKVMEPRNPDPAIVQDPSLVRVSDPDIATIPTASPVPVSTVDSDPLSVLDPDPLPVPVRVPARARAVPANRRRFFCTKCDFSTRTSQALANHAKTHNRKKPALQRASPCLQAKLPFLEPALPSGSPSHLASTPLACGHCAFLAPSQTVLREHQNLAHPDQAAVSGVWSEETGRRSRSSVDAPFSKDSDHLSASGSTPLSSPPEGQSQLGATAVEDSAQECQTPNSPAACQNRELAFKCIGNRRANRRGSDWTKLTGLHPIVDDNKEAQHEGSSTQLDTELNQKETNTPAGLKPHTRARSLLDSSSKQQSSASSCPPEEKSVNKEEGQEVEEDGKVSLLRRSSRVIAASAENDSDEDDVDVEQMRRFLAEGILDEDEEEIDEETGAPRSVERKCPYCADRFHNGIGLANHVRGHLNRVGVSYNVRHFISPEEVNAIEKKFSYQKKKKKVANFDPDTFSVMRCEFCSAGFDTRAGLSSHARAHLRDFGITNWEVTVSPIHILRELFSSRPDLVIPTAPPRSPGSQPDEEDEEDEEEEDDGKERREGKLGGEKSERIASATVSNPLPSASPQPWKSEHGANEPEGGEEGEEEEEEEEPRIPALDSLSSSPGRKGLLSLEPESLSPREDADTKVPDLLKCEVCGAHFETRRGLSSHARSHLRQLGVGVSESSGAPIDLLYQITKERSLDGEFTPPLPRPPSGRKPSPGASSAPQTDEDFGDMEFEEKPIPLSILAKSVKPMPPSSSSTPPPSPGASPPPPGPVRSCSPSSVVRKAPISSLLPVSSPLRSLDHKPGGMKGLTSNLSAHATLTTTKPFWAPQESDAPLNLTLEVDPNKDIICQLCGAWFETRKGLSSHARAHLRHFGVEYSESKGSPIDLLNQLIHTDDFKHKASALQPESPAELRGLAITPSQMKRSLFIPSSSSSSSSTTPLLYKVTTVGGGTASKATSSSVPCLLGPPAKRSKSSSMQVFRLSSGEIMAVPHNEPPKEIGCEFCGEYFENRKGLSSHARSHLRQMGITEWSVNGSPIDTLREIITRRGLPCALPLRPLITPPPSSPGPPRSPLSSSSSSSSVLGRLPFAFARPSSPQSTVCKLSTAPATSSAGLILKLKPEPVQLEVTMPGAAGGSGGFSSELLNCSWSSSDNVFPLNLAMTHEVEPTRDIQCEFCGEYFENRKGLSSHARSHLRQMGITEWSVNGSPIDTLREIMHKRGEGASSPPPGQGVKQESSQEANSPTWDDTGGLRGLEGLGILGYQSSKFRKSPINLLHSGSRLHKQGLGAVGLSATPPTGKFFRVSQLGKRPPSEEARPAETAQSPSHQLKTFSPLPHDFSFKRKSSPDKHGAGQQDASCELCGFYFENRKALASHARAHLRQFGVTEWCVNGSPIETLSAWIRSRPQKVLDMHRTYMQGNRSTPKKKSCSPLSLLSDSDHLLSVSSQKPSSSSSSSSSSQWSAVALSQVRTVSHEVGQGSSKMVEGEACTNLLAPPTKPSHSGHSSTLPPQAQVARSELNVRLPRGFERRPMKHPSHPDGPERESGPSKPPRTGTVPALVPKPPSYPLVKLVGKFYTLKCRFCEVEFHGPLSVQEDWIRHLQQHILKMNYSKPTMPRASSTDPPAQADDLAPVQASVPAPASTLALASTSSSTSTTPVLTSTPASTPTHTTARTVTPRPPSRSPTPPSESAPTVTATPIAKISEEQPTLIPTPTPTHSPIPTQAK